ncbi:hypothetical protein PO124_33715 [Bacillus licheniformis]|nr:hypothetical protein [Bacillus licheniformis]
MRAKKTAGERPAVWESCLLLSSFILVFVRICHKPSPSAMAISTAQKMNFQVPE